MHEKKAGEHNIITMLTLPQLNHPTDPQSPKKVHMEHSTNTPQTPFHMPSTHKTFTQALRTNQLQKTLWLGYIHVESLSDLLVCYLLGERSCVDEVCDERGHPQFQSGGNEQC